MKNQLITIFKDSFYTFLKEESSNIASNVSERNLCSRLAIYLTCELNRHGIIGYYADTEYNRKQEGKVKTILDDKLSIIPIQCDLIVHSRGNNIQQDNLIAIEMKKTSRPAIELTSDRNRLRALTKDSYDDIWSYDGIALPEHVCRYIIGIYIIIDTQTGKVTIEYYEKGSHMNTEVID